MCLVVHLLTKQQFDLLHEFFIVFDCNFWLFSPLNYIIGLLTDIKNQFMFLIFCCHFDVKKNSYF